MLDEPALPAAPNGGVPTEPRGSRYASAVAAVRVGDVDSARSILRSLLGGDVPVLAGPPIDVDLSSAAGLYAGVLAALGFARAALGYSAYAYEATRAQAQSESDPHLQAALAHTYVLRATGDPAAAVAVGRDLARALIARFGATDRRTLAAHADLAVTLHAAGECLSARQILHRTAEVFRQTYGPDDRLGVRMSDRFAALTRACSASDVDGVARAGEIVAEHVCGRPDRTLSASTADLFLDLFALSRAASAESPTVDPVAAVAPRPVAVPTAVEPESVEPEPVATAVAWGGPGSEDADREAPDAAVADASDPASVARDQPAVGPAGPLAALALAIPAARPTAPPTSGPDLVEAEVTPVPAPTVVAPVPVPTVAVDDTVAADEVTVAPDAADADGAGARDPHVVATAVDATARPDEPSVKPMDAAAGDDLAADEPPIPVWADRPTAGYPTVPVATRLHPTWVTASEVPLAGVRPMDETSTVAVIDEMVAAGLLTHSRATFGRMRRRLTHIGAADRPQRTATSGSAKTTDGE